MIAATRAKLIPLLNALRPQANNDVLVELAKLYADEYEALWLKSDVSDCYLYASGNTSRNYTDRLPDVLKRREVKLEESVVRTASRRAPIPDSAIPPIAGKLKDS